MLCFPNAKINLGLSVTGKRSDGFHNIETIFYPIPLCDILEVINSPDGTFTFTMSGLQIDGDPLSNLCVKAYQLLSNQFTIPAVKIHLHKVIPAGAGLGGGSSDGTFILKLLNNLFQLDINILDLQKYASILGSDCVFFIENKPALASGKGEVLQPCSVNLKKYHFVIVKPNVHITTVWAYSQITPQKPKFPVEAVVSLPIEKWKSMLFNDFEEPVIEKFPVIGEIKQALYSQGAIFAAMAGSGSAVYGIFKKQIQPQPLFPGCFVWSY
ncbi:MAG: 4-(cytidine 5'-diphospho)-2-C-methyl-D-erythritol kinase [Lentimicrobiaceae bacterium]|nr:4-(cytidine 5'-diphospho)-2-C-methyl-D-erythritol kinase [Lentimicrobiaceae bacterium]